MQREQGPSPQRPIANAAFQPTSSGTGGAVAGSSDTVCLSLWTACCTVSIYLYVVLMMATFSDAVPGSLSRSDR